MKKLILVVAVALLFSCKENKTANSSSSSSSSNEQSNNYSSKIDSLLEIYEESNQFMGSIAVSKNGKIEYTNAIGFDDIYTKKKSTIDTKYRIGSISKTFTAVLVFKAIEKNIITLEQTIESFFPEIQNASKITIAQLLQHRSGIYNFTRDKAFRKYHTQYKPTQEMLQMISDYPSDFEPGSKGEYSNSNYFLLSLILEKVYDKPYETILNTKICTPLNLTNTYNGAIVNINNNEANSYTYTTKWTKSTETDMSITLGAGSIVSNPTNIALFMNALFTGKIITPQSLDKMLTIKDTYGMGLARYTIADKKGFGHRGTLDGYKSTAIYFPEEKLGLTITSNGSNDNINTLFIEILKLYLDETPVEITENEVKIYSGTYVNIESDTYIFSQDKNVLIHIIGDEFKEPLVYKGNNRFVFEQIYAESMSFTFSPDGKQLTIEQGDYKGTAKKK